MNVKEALDILLNEEHLADWVYNVRSRAVECPWPKGSKEFWKGDNSWDHPRVERFSEVVNVLKKFHKSL